MSTVVKAQPGDSVHDLIRKFKRRVVRDQVLTEARKRQRYTKPSEERKEKRKELERRDQFKRRSRKRSKK